MGIFDSAKVAFLPTRSIGPFEAYVVIRETGEDSLTITENPVQGGAAITDHSIVMPSILSISIAYSENDVSLDEIYSLFLELQKTREPIDVVTGKRIYENMLIQAINQTTDANSEHSLSLELTLREMIIVNTADVIVVQQNAAKTGSTESKGQRQLEETSNQSTLSRIGEGFNSIFG